MRRNLHTLGRSVMNRAPIRTSAMLLLAVFLCWEIPQAEACSECRCFSDTGCAPTGCDFNLTTNCTRTQFSPACTGDYSFRTETRCTGMNGDCSKCQSCANIYKLDGNEETWIANCHTSDCSGQNPDCDYLCSAEIELSANATYVMYVCLVPCPGSNCVSCTENCTAYACLYTEPSTGPCEP